MNAADALARTMLLMRTNLRAEASDAALLDALTSVKVVLVADAKNLASHDGQHAFVATTLLIARSGGKCFSSAPNVRLGAVHAPLEQTYLLDALLDVGRDMIPGQEIAVNDQTREPDLAVIFGDTAYSGSARQVMRLSGDAWEGRLGPTGTRWISNSSPFGALAAAGLAAGEAYKVAMRRLRNLALPGPFDDFFRATERARVAFAPRGTPPPVADLGCADMVSGGAITHAALYALARIPGVRGKARVIEQDANEITNINRYALLRRKGLGVPKAAYLSSLDLGDLEIEPVPLRYEASQRNRIGPLAPVVLVGVDNVESRWAVQEEHPQWLGIGATEEYLAFLTLHGPGLPCAKCVHEGGNPPAGAVPTAAFVSHWAGLALAAVFARKISGMSLQAGEQITQFACLQLGSSTGIWKMRANSRNGCPNGCARLVKAE